MVSNLKILTLKKGMDFKSLAKELDIPRNVLSEISRGKIISFKRVYLEKLVEYFDCNINEIIDFKKVG